MASTVFSCVSSLRRIQTRLSASRRQQQLLLAGARAGHVDGGEDALLHQAAVEVDLHVAGALELLEDDLVHPAAGVDQRGGDDGEAAAVLDVARGAEELLRACAARWSRRRRRGSCPLGGTTVL